MAIAETPVEVDHPAEEVKSWKALLDDNGVLLGFDRSGRSNGIAVPVDCDLEPGKYRWIGPAARWEPIIKEFPKALPAGPPDMLIAMALGLRAIGRTIPLPAYTLAWLEGFERYPDDWTPGKAE